MEFKPVIARYNKKNKRKNYTDLKPNEKWVAKSICRRVDLASRRNSRHVNFRSLENDWDRNTPLPYCPLKSERVALGCRELDNKHSQIQSQIWVPPSFFRGSNFSILSKCQLRLLGAGAGPLRCDLRAWLEHFFFFSNFCLLNLRFCLVEKR
ncbi:hypothetical protein CDAR_578831 [Caerostris darwini]|uniref:Uncharacterized protein n=1 Tax=Caerostris darwini TaxID=1538125 RepID=A0AAV4UBS8_9ARAC|nr:hypothetical protein CDAR_578831 [Caerostris darwini]